MTLVLVAFVGVCLGCEGATRIKETSSSVLSHCPATSFARSLHHSFPDTPADPYGPIKGFWYSHCLWMFENVDRTKWMARINVQDLKEDKVWVDCEG